MSQCTYLDPEDPSVGCDRPAHWLIEPAGLPGDRREACILHAGSLLVPGRVNLLLPLEARRARCRGCGAPVEAEIARRGPDGGVLCPDCASLCEDDDGEGGA